MAGQNTAPYFPQDVQETAKLIRNLESNSKKDGLGKKHFSCKKSTFPVPGSNLTVDSWRFRDWDYKRDDLPTYARGLFTTKNQNGQPEIAVRGYDKFFNTGEVPATKWDHIEKDTVGPYELSLKENGCIIFISGLCDGSLLVCSKHSTGYRSDLEVSHASAGERWVDRQLEALGKTRQDLAMELRKRNATAVAELCDDEFEEHILAYNKDSAGLYLHGININIPDFTTYSGSQVQAFADEWGFKRTEFLVIEGISGVRTFLESVAETGSYNGRDVEGFVIRCKSRVASGPNQDWFFKYKFEEPYLMYRQWRECTKAMISGKTPRFSKHVKITEDYLIYARKRLASEPGLAKSYNQNHGIITLRDDFLKEINMKGSDIIRQEYGLTGDAPEDVNKDVILVPIATIGCGKTTIAIALTHLFSWGHVQNDNITGKNRPPRFTTEVLDQLQHAPVVYADRNNAQKHERKQLITDVHRLHPSARLVALNFVHTKQTLDRIRDVTHDRVFSRGDNHQTIQATTDPNKVLGIMESFIQRFEALQPFTNPDDGFDAAIDLDPTLESRQNLESVISQLHNLYPKLFTDMPTSEDIDGALKVALNEYKPDIKHDLSRGPKKKASEVCPMIQSSRYPIIYIKTTNSNPIIAAKVRKCSYFNKEAAPRIHRCDYI
jgi:tRNA ligase